LTSATLVVSLDFELHWGRFDKYALTSNLGYYRNTIATFPRILDLFSKYSLHATWATVGSLMAKNREEWESFAPDFPPFRDRNVSGVSWFKHQEQLDELGLFAPQLVRLILDTPHQELASHTFSHFYTGVEGSDPVSFAADLKAAKEIAAVKFGFDLKSLVFPRNQYEERYLTSAAACGFEAARTNPADWFWDNPAEETILKKLFRTGDTLFPLGKRTSYSHGSVDHVGLVRIPASRLLRPYRKNSIFNKRRIERIKSELDFACERGEVYHLWWHPHNFGHRPEENMEVLRHLLSYIREKIDSGKLVSRTMYEYSQWLKSNAAGREEVYYDR
jgi:peptidoglycan/xylan/chitin deacetylase (PgdA/CDA1 family)